MHSRWRIDRIRLSFGGKFEGIDSMKILFIRHGETTDNLRHVYAGVTDSALTAHGVLQTARLATHLATAIPPITHLYTSPLSRARRTAEVIRDEQRRRPAAATTAPVTALTPAADSALPDVAAPDVPDNGSSNGAAPSTTSGVAVAEGAAVGGGGEVLTITVDDDLIEQDFGSYEGLTFLTAAPRGNLKKRKRSVAEPSAGDAKKRKAGERDGAEGGEPSSTAASNLRRDSVHSTISATTSPTRADVIMAGENSSPVTHHPPTTLPPTDTTAENEEEEEEEEEFRQMETPASIKARAESFINRCIIPLLPDHPVPSPSPSTSSTTPPTPSNAVVAIVSHGMLLSWLWRAFVALFPPTSVLATTPVVQKGWYQGKHPGWGNTGYLVVEVLPAGVVSAQGMTVVIEGVNEKTHLAGLRRTGGGIGSERFDERQTKVDAFFSRREGEDGRAE
ncbi:hypothetical protein Dda_4321 [Drechslerella dactyloides]|uniref:Phosphoglycerate mutase-like protein n=1 Tax=Drechslerella dactyloides TaxID=74499 RepID=A0AAD6IYX1_DREDA|nr:hypothetical protein Dda_4321 [Drechslerella dactyloides]